MSKLSIILLILLQLIIVNGTVLFDDIRKGNIWAILRHLTRNPGAVDFEDKVCKSLLHGWCIYIALIL